MAGRKTLPHTRMDDRQTYKIEVRRWIVSGGSGRYESNARKYLIPAKSQTEAETRARERFRGSGSIGPQIKVKKVANYHREYD